jgi:hypothetical protein
LLLVISVGALAVGCAGEDEPTPSTDGLVGMLGSVRATDETAVAVEYGEPARIAGLGERFQALQGYGFGTIAASSRLVEGALGVDPSGFDQGIVAGQAPDWGAVLLGDYDLERVDGRLSDLGIDHSSSNGATVWVSAEDNEIHLSDGPFTGVVPTSEFNVVRTAAGSFAFAPASRGVEWVTEPGDRTLADDEKVAALADCLGDVIAARIDERERAAGVTAEGAEVLCLSGDKAKVEQALRGDVPSTREPWDELLSGASVEQDAALVRVTTPGRDGEPVGRVLRTMVTGDARALTD